MSSRIIIFNWNYFQININTIIYKCKIAENKLLRLPRFQTLIRFLPKEPFSLIIGLRNQSAFAIYQYDCLETMV
jgi:hypothetical protein